MNGAYVVLALLLSWLYGLFLVRSNWAVAAKQRAAAAAAAAGEFALRSPSMARLAACVPTVSFLITKQPSRACLSNVDEPCC